MKQKIVHGVWTASSVLIATQIPQGNIKDILTCLGIYYFGYHILKAVKILP